MRAPIAASVVALLTLWHVLHLAAAPKVKFPYEATVESDEAPVRAGPGRQYYATTRLPRGARVTVHRHDPGGWHMIAPPAGSFSWIPAKYVQRLGGDRGSVTANNVAARVGSQESDAREVFQSRLSEGDEVRILAVKRLETRDGAEAGEEWLQIEPPRGEWRWIQGQQLSPPPSSILSPAEGTQPPDAEGGSGATANQNRAANGREDFVDDASRLYQESPDERPVVAQRPMKRSKLPAQDSRGAAVRDRTLERQLAQLDQLDARLRALLDEDPLEWNFAPLEEDYRALREKIANGNVRAMIDARLTRIAQFKAQQARARDVAQIMEATSRREAELVQVQERQEARLLALRQPRFDAAGIVDRAALAGPHAPRFALLATNGRVLAYLLPGPGIDLGRWLRHAVGVTGSRTHDPRLRADVITVTGISAVQLLP